EPAAFPVPTRTVIVEPSGASQGVTSTTLFRSPGTSSRLMWNPSFFRTLSTFSKVWPFASLQNVLTSLLVGDGWALVPGVGLLPPVPLVLCSNCQPTKLRMSRSRTPMSTARMIIVLRPLLWPVPPGGGWPGWYVVSPRDGGSGGTAAAPRWYPAGL